MTQQRCISSARAVLRMRQGAVLSGMPSACSFEFFESHLFAFSGFHGFHHLGW